jgi:hypothetical protein
MKIIDQTPFYKDKTKLSLMDRGRVIMQFGSGWIKEVEAQNSVISVLDKVLDKKFTLLHNVTPPGLGTMVPFILVGPTGVYVLGVQHLPGMFSARGDQWGIIVGGVPKPEKPNLLTRTERMARAIQVYLKRRGYADLNGVEAVLICSDPATNVDSVRPIIRVVMRDALERFAVSVSQARLVHNPETVYELVNHLMNPPSPHPPEPVLATPAVVQQSADVHLDSDKPVPDSYSAFNMVPPPAAWETSSATGPETAKPVEPGLEWLTQPVEPPNGISQAEPLVRRRKAFTARQVGFLIIMALVWILIVAVFVFLIARDYLPQLFIIK